MAAGTAAAGATAAGGEDSLQTVGPEQRRSDMSAVPTGGGVPTPIERARRTVLPSGVRVLTDAQPERSTVAVSVWVAVGSRDESSESAGSSHFLEHLLFKGTSDHDALAIARAMDSLGGEINAFTSSEHTAFYVRAPSAYADEAVDLLFEVVERPLLAASEVESERQVILEELAAADDDPDDVSTTKLFESLFPDHPLGRETLGTTESVGSIGRDEIADFFERWYRSANLVVAAAGDVDHDRLVGVVGGRFGLRSGGAAPERAAPGVDVVPVIRTDRHLEQIHLSLGWRAPSVNDDDRFPLAILNHLFGGGPSSRLFQEIREARGLTYAVGSEVSHYVDAGALSVHCTTAPRNLAAMSGLIDLIVAGLSDELIGEAELARAKGALLGGLTMGLESPAARMSRLGASESLRGEVMPLAEHVARIEAVSAEEVRSVARRVFGGPRATSAVGPPGTLSGLDP